MDSFLSGREELGGKPKPKDNSAILSEEVLAKLNAPEEGSETKTCESEGGSVVEYVTREGRVTKIVVTCACGQVTEIDCDYEEE